MVTKENVLEAHLFFEEALINALHERFHKYEIYSGNELSQTIKSMNSTDIKTFSAVGKEKFQSLYGRLYKIHTKIRIDAILDKAQALKKNGLKNRHGIEALRLEIGEIWENHQLSRIDTCLLHAALIILEGPSFKKKINMLDPLSKPMEKKMALSTDQERVELAFELLELANFFYKGEIKKGFEAAKALPKDLFLPPISQSSSPDEIAAFIQEAVIKSFEVSRKDGYTPSFQEILELLEEASTFS